MSDIGLRTGDRVRVVTDYASSSPTSTDAVFLGIDTARDGVTPEAVIVQTGHGTFRHRFGDVLIERAS